MIHKNEMPILEYDSAQTAVIMPNRKELFNFPKKAVFPFLFDEIEKYAETNKCTKIAEFVSITKIYPIYKTNYQGYDICLCQAPLGSSASVQILDFLIGYGVEEIISVGTCGDLLGYAENEFLLPVKHYGTRAHLIIICHPAEL